MAEPISEKLGLKKSEDIQDAAEMSDGSTKEQTDSHDITRDRIRDEQDPMNWPSGKKWRILAVVSAMTFVTLVKFTVPINSLEL